MKKNKLLLHKQILAAVLSGGILLLPNWGYALPQGGQVVAGTGSIGTPGGDQMNITGSGNVAVTGTVLTWLRANRLSLVGCRPC